MNTFPSVPLFSSVPRYIPESASLILTLHSQNPLNHQHVLRDSLLSASGDQFQKIFKPRFQFSKSSASGVLNKATKRLYG